MGLRGSAFQVKGLPAWNILPERANVADRLHLAPPVLEIVHRRTGAEPRLPGEGPGADDGHRPSSSKGKVESSIAPNPAK